MTHPHHIRSRSLRSSSRLGRLITGVAARMVATLMALLSFTPPSAAAGAGNAPFDPSALTPPVPALFNASCSRVGNHISCSLAFDDPDVIVNEPSGIICDHTELLISQTRSVV